MLIGARLALWGAAKPRVPTARDYVQDGLIAMWDGIENAGWGQHDEALPVADWPSLVNSSNITRATAASDISSCYAFTDNSVSLTDASSANSQRLVFTASGLNAQAPFTLDVCLKGAICSLGNFYWAAYGSGTFRIQNSNNAYGYFGGTGTYNEVLGSAVTSTVACSTSGITGYANGVQNSESQYPVKSGTGLLRVNVLGTRQVRVEGSELFCLRLYSRALTAEEIAANYAVDKARFNLP